MAKKKQKKSMLFWAIFAIVVIAGLWYYYKMPAEPKPVENISVPVTGIQMGDMIAVNYAVAMTNGSVVDTNNEALAKEYGIGTFTKGPYRFIVGQSGKVKGFDHAFAGMEPGNYTRIISPSEQVLAYQVNKTRSVSRNQPVPRFQPFPYKLFEGLFGRKAVLNDIVSNPKMPWPYKVINLTEKYVICDSVVAEGKSYKLPSLDWNSTLLVVTFNDLMFRHNPVEGQIINTEFGNAVVHPDIGRINITYQAKIDDVVNYSVPLGVAASISLPQKFRVTQADDNSFTITRFDYLPQETLMLKTEVLEWEKNVKEVKEPIKAEIG